MRLFQRRFGLFSESTLQAPMPVNTVVITQFGEISQSPQGPRNRSQGSNRNIFSCRKKVHD